MTERTEWNMKDETTALCIPYTIGLPDASILCKCHSRFFEARCDLQISFENIFFAFSLHYIVMNIVIVSGANCIGMKMCFSIRRSSGFFEGSTDFLSPPQRVFSIQQLLQETQLMLACSLYDALIVLRGVALCCWGSRKNFSEKRKSMKVID